jgi:hypothetical protein
VFEKEVYSRIVGQQFADKMIVHDFDSERQKRSFKELCYES